jgi:hypothetical protein
MVGRDAQSSLRTLGLAPRADQNGRVLAVPAYPGA